MEDKNLQKSYVNIWAYIFFVDFNIDLCPFPDTHFYVDFIVDLCPFL